MTALEVALEKGHREVARLLLDKGSDLDKQGSQYGNAHQATSEGAIKRTLLPFLEKEADMVLKRVDNKTCQLSPSEQYLSQTGRLVCSDKHLSAQAFEHSSASKVVLPRLESTSVPDVQLKFSD